MKTLIQVENLRKTFGSRVLLDAVTVTFTLGQKIGVIGRNGAGKSTFCRIVSGEEEYDAGSITFTQALRLGYLQQDDPWLADEEVMNFLRRHTKAPDWRCSLIAGQFQIRKEMMSLPIAGLAGGFRMRLKLAAMLMGDPNFLILDEPTNFLDLSTQILFEEFLRKFAGGYLIVSHDREFMKRACRQTLEFESGRATLYQGDIEKYLASKQEKIVHAELYNQKIDRKKKHLEGFVNRFRAKASKATQAKSKLKQIARLERIEIVNPSTYVRLRIPRVEARKGLCFDCGRLTIGYPEKTVASEITMDIDRGTHVAVLGDNGEGKTTFLRTIAGDLPPVSGRFRFTAGHEIGYYAQHVYSAIPEELSVIDYLNARSASDVLRQEILDTAGSFLFSGDDVKKKVAVLSGGERARLCLAGLLLTKCNVLLLDEPTNHLDFETVEALGNAIRDYKGTIVFVSHDRSFVSQVASEIIEVKAGRITKYPGGYEDFVYSLSQRLLEAPTPDPASGEKSPASGAHAIDPEGEDGEGAQLELELLDARLGRLKEEKKGIERGFPGFPQKWSKRGEERLAEVTTAIVCLTEERKALKEKRRCRS